MCFDKEEGEGWVVEQEFWIMAKRKETRLKEIHIATELEITQKG
jgi:multidrug resistance efflux pump